MLSRLCWDNIAQEYCLASVIQIHLRQNCTKKYLCNVGPECTDVFLQENNPYNIALTYLYQLCKSELCLCNVGPQPMNNFAQENNLQYCFDLCRPTYARKLPVQRCVYQAGQHCIEIYRMANVVQIRLKQHGTRKLLAQYWSGAYRHVFAEKQLT